MRDVWRYRKSGKWPVKLCVVFSALVNRQNLLRSVTLWRAKSTIKSIKMTFFPIKDSFCSTHMSDFMQSRWFQFYLCFTVFITLLNFQKKKKKLTKIWNSSARIILTPPRMEKIIVPSWVTINIAVHNKRWEKQMTKIFSSLSRQMKHAPQQQLNMFVTEPLFIAHSEVPTFPLHNLVEFQMWCNFRLQSVRSCSGHTIYLIRISVCVIVL